MNATIETHWSRILYCDIFAASAEMPHPSESVGGGARGSNGGKGTAMHRMPSSAGAQRGGARASHFRKEA